MQTPSTKWIFLNLYSMDYQTMTDYFTEMAAQGWMLQRLGDLTVRFQKTKPQNLSFDIGIYPDENLVNSWDDPLCWDNYQDIQESGWKPVCSRKTLHVFCASAGNPPSPIHSDRREEEKCIHKINWKSALKHFWSRYFLFPFSIPCFSKYVSIVFVDVGYFRFCQYSGFPAVAVCFGRKLFLSFLKDGVVYQTRTNTAAVIG